MQATACPRLAFPLDVASLGEARGHIERLSPQVGVFKVGLELFIAAGPAAVEAVHEAGAACFLDLKLHDIPATVARSVQVACDLGVRYLTLHASNGPIGLQQAARAAEGSDTQLLAVTLLTSMDAASLSSLGIPHQPAAWVMRLAQVSIDAGVEGFVTSPEECAELRRLAGPQSVIVTPGIRPPGAALGDQKRVSTPSEAIQRGADLLVVGRPIRDAADPLQAATAIAAEIRQAAQTIGTP